jgi:3',5'-cyclic AMP phosphodiesterase CpdA
MTSILHISDIQFGDLCQASPADPGKPETIVRDPLFVSLFDYVKAEWEKPDLIILTGDITTRAAPVEFLQAESFLNVLRSLWGDPQVAIFMVPGNHDVSWDILGLDDKSPYGYRGLRFAPYFLAARRERFETHTIHDIKSSESHHIVHFLELGTPSLAIAGINSAVEDERDTKPHHGYVADRQLEVLKSRVSSCSADLKIVALHHHIRPLRDPPRWRDYSAAVNAQALTDLLAPLKIDLVLHGHRHCPNYDKHVDSTWQTHIFGAGSLATTASERGEGDVRCSAHLIRVEGRDNGIAYGKILTIRLYGAAGACQWKPKEDGFPAIRRFGRTISPAELKQMIGQAVKSSAGNALIGKVLSGIPGLAGVDPAEIRLEIEKQLKSIGFVLAEADRDVEHWRAYRDS